MEYTQNYALRKPGLNEYANVRDLNFNADKIDSQMRKNQDVDGEVYDPTTTSSNAYEAGDYVINPDDGLMYVCNETTYGPWDSTKWDHTTEFDEIQKAMASGGESELADLHDVDIDNPTNGQALLYDPTSLKWHNSDLPDADVTKTASGNPIEFEDGASAPLVRCETEIVGSQDLHGYDKPWVGGVGKNILPITVDGIKALNTTGTWSGNVYTRNNTTFTLQTDNGNNVVGILVNGTPSANVGLDLARYKSSTTTILNGCPVGGSSETYNLQITRVGAIDTGSGANVNVYGGNDSTCYIYVGSGAQASNLLFKPMIRLSTVTDQTFAPYSNICPITAYTEGEIEVRGKNIFDIDAPHTSFAGVTYQYDISGLKPNTNYTLSTNDDIGSASLSNLYINGTSSATNGVFKTRPATVNSGAEGTATIYVRYNGGNLDLYTAVKNGTYYIQLEEGSTATDYEPYTSTTHSTTFPTSIYRGSEDCVNGTAITEWGMIASYAGETLPGEWISDRDEYAPGTTPTTGAQVAYALATPTTSSVTPTNLPIKSLYGYNHIESSTGEMEVEYIAKAFSPITEIVDSQISALSKMMELMLTSARETTMTASANYTTGTLIVACGALYKATTAISSGASLVVGTNITPTTIAAELAALA